MREKGKQEKTKKTPKKHTPTDKQTYTNTDTHIHINTLCVIPVR